ncbi:hypothetical protein WICMUC_004946 [Wickerhamomyces mucosus]|uniref:Thiaminase-2/PQQC domain-containing protein n=1 Tax=Wickerhamomyces mucosus TaxID=1378264 RepID=A0A9P8PDZ2_9ASCO|nr:hypothetical protein WICMUC_004946 [Wickerhamomyces mucosus]
MTSFSEQLKTKYSEQFKKATQHEFTEELVRGILSDDKLLVYLIQDLKFFQFGLRLTCKLASLSDDDKAQIAISKQIGFFANDENDYFTKAIEEVSNTTNFDVKSLILQKTQRYVLYLKNLLENPKISYAQLVTVIYVMEDVYLEWAQRGIDTHVIPIDLPYKYKEWIDLHSGAGFTSWVKLLKDEVDRVGDLTCEKFFQDILNLEYDFFDACYNYNNFK